MLNFNTVKESGKALLDIFYPNICQVCSVSLVTGEKFICIKCFFDLPFLEPNQETMSQLQKRFWGRVEVDQVYSLLDYQKGNTTQSLLHEIKYKGKKKLGEYLGELLGEQIDSLYDFIIPVPLHKKKQRHRGYNQSEIIANGICRIIDVPININCLKRTHYSRSQTRFTRFDRWENVTDIFALSQIDKVKNKKVLLVDDVLTTGATLESAARKLLEIEGVKLSIATIAIRV